MSAQLGIPNFAPEIFRLVRPKDPLKANHVMKAMDRVNQTMGRNKVRLAVQGFDRKWRLKQEKLSPCYTTRFSDIVTVKL